MKRFFIIIACIGLISIFSGGCHKDRFSNILVCGFSDSVPEIAPKLEYSEWSKDSYIDSKQPQTVNVKIGSVSYSGAYIETEPIFGTYEMRHTYIDEDRNFFEINDEGILTAFFRGNGETSKEMKTRDECKKIACDFISDIWGLSLAEHEEYVSYDDERKMYTFTFAKFIRNVKSEDTATVVVETTGHIYSYRSSLFGKISETNVPAFNLEKIQENVSARLDDLTKEACKGYDRVEYKDYSYRVSMINDSEYILLCDVNVDCINTIEEFDTILGEKLQFIIYLT
jgi:lipoprotein